MAHKYPTDAAVWPGLAMSAAINFVIFDLAIRRESWPRTRSSSDGRQSDQFCDSGTCHWSVVTLAVISHCVNKISFSYSDKYFNKIVTEILS